MCGEAISKQRILQKCVKVLHKYEWLLNSYFLDFYVDDHWKKLTSCWQTHFNDIPLEQLSTLLDHNAVDRNYKISIIWPLELLALKELLRELCIKRKPSKMVNELPDNVLFKHPKLKYPSMRRVKIKKLHEIQRMAALCAHNCHETNVNFVVDFGAGLGHLARILGYGYGIQVCCLEMQSGLNDQAIHMDLKFERIAIKYMSKTEIAAFKRPVHFTLQLSSDTKPEDFVRDIKNALNINVNNFNFGIIGLHACGDLSAILLRMFLSCKEAKFLNFVGCCYHKLSTPATEPAKILHGFPLSNYMQQHLEHVNLSYEAREISCHASEMYYDRLKSGDYDNLRLHSFRAVAEDLIHKHFPTLKHLGLKSVKYAQDLSFKDYFYRAVSGLPIAKLDPVHLNNAIIETDLLHWRRIVIFYTLRLMLAPLVETVILYDRYLFLIENDCKVNIEAVFDPRLSPRNQITWAAKI